MPSDKTSVVIGPSWVVTILPSGKEVHAHPTADQLPIAESLGYGTDLPAMTQDHDPLHTYLCGWLGLGPSFSLRQTAGELPEGLQSLAWLEEEAVMAIQKFWRAARQLEKRDA